MMSTILDIKRYVSLVIQWELSSRQLSMELKKKDNWVVTEAIRRDGAKRQGSVD